ncbi:YdcF family protein [Rhizobium sp. B230/85]|nr:YdcF family protein [Rhizobium sp. L58/93]MBO9135797.1 YdcF family protein [Rhizobium sp. B209b/85]MBO9169988.1 YdcF family protein [Rhizobium sp. L245/93]MBO9185940.1 YdcF family protein [Rhizobium sp. E27B/91]QXZ85856.1 YdcF family protein [Rhizobium sp. K1/93]QXZ91962.1 YdcF family protein [Rhizobium sp. K15/93]QXZ97681.1 YdcF family protein [Rhizobium sp. B230/85]QYA03315.1 YdcF family protein [Rhizobium sp. B21/90]
MEQMTRNTLDPATMQQAAGGENPPRRSVFRRIMRWTGFATILAGAILFGGFLRFADSVTTLRPPLDPKADAIVVLTGGYQRIDQAIELLRSGAGNRLLISGAYPATTRKQIAKATQTPPDLFACCVDIGYDAIDTIGNASETVKWIHAKGYKSVLVVTNNYHMPRSIAELRYADPEMDFIPYPVVNSDLKTKAWFTDPNALRTMLSEYAKVLLTGGRNLFGFARPAGLRSQEQDDAQHKG